MSNHLWLVSLFWLESWESFRYHKVMVRWFSSPTDKTVLFNFHSCKSLYIIYSARALSTLCILWHSVCGSCCALGEWFKDFWKTHIRDFYHSHNYAGQPSPGVFCRANWAASPRTSYRSELHANELTGLHVVWHPAAAVALLGEHEIHVRMLQTISTTHYPTLYNIYTMY